MFAFWLNVVDWNSSKISLLLFFLAFSLSLSSSQAVLFTFFQLSEMWIKSFILSTQIHQTTLLNWRYKGTHSGPRNRPRLDPATEEHRLWFLGHPWHKGSVEFSEGFPPLYSSPRIWKGDGEMLRKCFAITFLEKRGVAWTVSVDMPTASF